MKRARIRIEIVCREGVEYGKRWRINIREALKAEWTFGFYIMLSDRIQLVPERESASDDESDEDADEKEPAIGRKRDRR
jgi:hypothetical protein